MVMSIVLIEASVGVIYFVAFMQQGGSAADAIYSFVLDHSPYVLGTAAALAVMAFLVAAHREHAAEVAKSESEKKSIEKDRSRLANQLNDDPIVERERARLISLAEYAEWQLRDSCPFLIEAYDWLFRVQNACNLIYGEDAGMRVCEFIKTRFPSSFGDSDRNEHLTSQIFRHCSRWLRTKARRLSRENMDQFYYNDCRVKGDSSD